MNRNHRRQQRKTEEMMRGVAEVLDGALADLYGKRLSFSLILWEQKDGERTNYISNTSRADAITALRATADRLEKGQMMPPGAITDQRNN